MPRNGRKIEKSKDFKGSIKKISKSLAPWHMFIVIAIVLASVSAILYLIAPNKLSDLTDYITDGLKPNINEKTIAEVMSDTSINQMDKMEFMKFLDESSKNQESYGFTL